MRWRRERAVTCGAYGHFAPLRAQLSGNLAPAARAARGGVAGMSRGDILVVMPDGRLIVADAVVTHPAGRADKARASRETGYAAAEAERAKWRDWNERGDGAGYEFVPLACESFGRMGRQAAGFLSQLGDVAAAGGRVSKSAFVRTAREELSCALARGNARMYGRAMAIVARSVGRAFLPGAAAATAAAGDV